MTNFKRKTGKEMPHHKSITSEELLQNVQELIIVHAGEQYRLRITSNNKLILTK